jgi:hypothetical protein
MIRVKLPNGTVVECDTPEEAARFTQHNEKKRCGRQNCSEPDDGSHCPACGHHHYGMC